MIQRWGLVLGLWALVGCALAGCPAAGTTGPSTSAPKTPAGSTTKVKEPASPELAKRDDDAPLPRAFSHVGKRLSARARNAIYVEWFARPYSYMFEHSGRPLTVLGRSFGRFLGGVDGIVLYGGLAVAIAKAQGLPHRGFYDMKPIAALSGLPLYKKKAATLDDFSRFNPALVRWGYQNLLPEPQDTLGNVAYREVYARIFARCFRLFAEARITLQKRGADAEVRAYLAAMQVKGFDGLAYQERRFAGALPGYRVANNNTNLTPAMAIGFWVRRHADGTDKELWIGLRKLLELYDGVFWRKIQQQAGQAAR